MWLAGSVKPREAEAKPPWPPDTRSAPGDTAFGLRHEKVAGQTVHGRRVIGALPCLSAGQHWRSGSAHLRFLYFAQNKTFCDNGLLLCRQLPLNILCGAVYISHEGLSVQRCRCPFSALPANGEGSRARGSPGQRAMNQGVRIAGCSDCTVTPTGPHRVDRTGRNLS